MRLHVVANATLMNSDEIAYAGVEVVKNALLDCLPERGVRTLFVNQYGEEYQIRFTVDIDGRPITFAVEVEPFLPPGNRQPLDTQSTT